MLVYILLILFLTFLVLMFVFAWDSECKQRKLSDKISEQWYKRCCTLNKELWDLKEEYYDRIIEKEFRRDE